MHTHNCKPTLALLTGCCVSLLFKALKLCEISCRSCRVKACVWQNHGNASELQTRAKFKPAASFLFKGICLGWDEKTQLGPGLRGLRAGLVCCQLLLVSVRGRGRRRSSRLCKQGSPKKASDQSCRHDVAARSWISTLALIAGRPCTSRLVSLGLRLLICKARARRWEGIVYGPCWL